MFLNVSGCLFYYQNSFLKIFLLIFYLIFNDRQGESAKTGQICQSRGLVVMGLACGYQLVMELGQNFLIRVESGQFFVARVGSGRVSHLWFGFGKFPIKMLNFSIFFSSDQRKTFWVGLKVRAHL